jgi:hypothetical protein
MDELSARDQAIADEFDRTSGRNSERRTES